MVTIEPSERGLKKMSFVFRRAAQAARVARAASILADT